MQFNLETDLPQRMEAHEAHEQRLSSTQPGRGSGALGLWPRYLEPVPGPRYLARRLSEFPPTSASLSESAYETLQQ